MKKILIVCFLVFSNLALSAKIKDDFDNSKSSVSARDSVINLAEYIVVADRVEKLSLSKLPLALEKTPLTISVVESNTLADLNMKDMLRLNKVATGIRVLNNYGGFNMYRIRGMDGVVLLFNGVRDERAELYSCAPNPSFVGVDRIEILKGASSAMNGHSAVGGIINTLYKQPSAASTIDASFSLGSWNTYTAQLGGSGSISDKLNFRLDFTSITSDAWRNNSKVTNNGYFALDYKPNAKNKFQFSVTAYDNRLHTDPGIPRFTDDVYDLSGAKIYSTGDIYKKADREKTNFTYYKDHLNDKQISTTNIWEHSFNKNWKLKEVFGFSYNTLNYLQSEDNAYLTSATQGNLNKYYKKITKDASGNELEERTYINPDSVKRGPFAFDYDTYYTSNKLELQGKLNALGMPHIVSIGYDISYLNLLRYQRAKFSGTALDAPMAFDNPDPNNGTLSYKFRMHHSIKELAQSVSFFDLTKVTDDISLMLALRYNLFSRTVRQDDTDHKTTVTKGVDGVLRDQAFTFKIGATYEFVKDSRLYVSVSNFFKPINKFGDAAYTYLDKNGNEVAPEKTGQVFVPESGIQYEVGTHSKIADKLSLDFSLFYLRKNNIVETLGIDDQGKQTMGQVGRATSKGFEIEAKYAPCRFIDINGGYALTIAKSDDFSSKKMGSYSFKGNYLRYAPVHTAYGWMQFNKNISNNLFKLGLGFEYSSKSYADLANKMWFNPAFVANMMTSYRIESWTLQLNIDNLFDKDYAMAAENTGQWMPEPGRGFTLTAIFNLK